MVEERDRGKCLLALGHQRGESFLRRLGWRVVSALVVESVSETAQHVRALAAAREQDGRVFIALSRRDVPFHSSDDRDVWMPRSRRADGVDELRRAAIEVPVAVIGNRHDVASVARRRRDDGFD